ncbi:MAG TPA: radical SAM protein [Bacteroidales bacterium]|nr:radical SAM protein [Bacteroidales bacterium]
MFDRFNRRINYLRVSVTDRCNLRCTYCMPEEGVPLLHHNDILRLEEIVEVIKVAVGMGISKIRITGGEPLVRKGIVGLVKNIAGIPGISDFGLTTNGILLEEFAGQLSDAGLHRINISLDTLDPEKFVLLTRGGDVGRVIRGIHAAKAAGLSPIKINCVVRNSSGEPDAIAVKQFCAEHGFEVRFIHEMNLADGRFTIVENGHGGDCEHCNRLRLTSNGMIRPCLFNDAGFSIRDLGIRQALEMAVGMKPEKGTLSNSHFNSIGG